MKRYQWGIVLAAGQGSRLGSVTGRIPKPLISIGPRNCLDIVLESLAKVVDQVVVIVGYLGEQIREYLENQKYTSFVHIIQNPTLTRGNLLTLGAARSLVDKSGFVLTNADHLFPANFYTRYFRGGSGIRIAAQRTQSALEDEMKVTCSDKCRLIAISKKLQKFDGSYIGTTRVSKASSNRYWAAFDVVKKQLDPTVACAEDVLQRLVVESSAPKLTWVDGVRWYEVDTPDDLQRARRALGNFRDRDLVQ